MEEMKVNNKNFQKGLAAVMLLMMIVPMIVSTQVAVTNYKISQEADAIQEVAMPNLDEENN